MNRYADESDVHKSDKTRHPPIGKCLTFFDQPALAAQAHEAVVELAHHRNLHEPNKAEFATALDQVLAASKNEIIRDRAQRYKNGQTWDRKTVSD